MNERLHQGDIRSALQDLYERHLESLDPSDWPIETSRWTQLVYRLLGQCGDRALDTNEAVTKVHLSLGLLDPRVLSELSNEQSIVLGYILKQHDFSPADAKQAVELLSDTAARFKSAYSSPAHCLVHVGEAMMDLIVGRLSEDSSSEYRKALHIAVTQWLWDALKLPLALDYEPVSAFYEQHGASFDEFVATVEDLGYNMAQVQLLIELESVEDRAARDGQA